VLHVWSSSGARHDAHNLTRVKPVAAYLSAAVNAAEMQASSGLTTANNMRVRPKVLYLTLVNPIDTFLFL